MSTFRNTLVPDQPIADTARAPFDATARAEADARSLASQQFLAECLVAGLLATYARLDPSSAPLAKGDAVARSGNTLATVTRGDAAALAAAGLPFGLALRATAPGSLALIALQGAVGPEVTGLAAGAAGPVRLTSGRPERVATFSSGDYPVGFVDAAGWLTLSPASSATSLLVSTSLPAVANTIPLRGSSAEVFSAWFAQSGGAGIGGSGLVRALFNSVIIGTKKADLSANISVLATNGADGITLGDATNTVTATVAVGVGGTHALSFGGVSQHAFEKNNIALFGAIDAHGAANVVNLHDSSTAPTTSATDGAIVYSEKGAVKSLSSNGVFATITPTDVAGGTLKQIDQQIGYVATSSAVSTLLLSITIPSTATTMTFDLDVQGYHVDTAYYARRTVRARRIAGGATSVSSLTFTGVADLDEFGGVVLAVAASGNAVEVKITGPASAVSWVALASPICIFKP